MATRLQQLIILLLNTTCSVLANNVDQDQLASEANWSGSALFAIKYVNFSRNFYKKKPNQDLLEIRSGCGILIHSAWQGLKIVIVAYADSGLQDQSVHSRTAHARGSRDICCPLIYWYGMKWLSGERRSWSVDEAAQSDLGLGFPNMW